MPLTREKMFSKKNIIVIAILAVMLMGSVVLSAATANVCVTTNGNGTGYVSMVSLEIRHTTYDNVSYETGENDVPLPIMDNTAYMACAYGVSDNHCETDNDSAFFTPGSGTIRLELDINGYEYLDPPTDPISR